MISTHKRRTIGIWTNSFRHFWTFFAQMSFTKFSPFIRIHFRFLIIYIFTNKRHVMSTLGTDCDGMILGTSPFGTGTIGTWSAYVNLAIDQNFSWFGFFFLLPKTNLFTFESRLFRAYILDGQKELLVGSIIL